MLCKFAMVKQMIWTRRVWQGLGTVALAIAFTTACTEVPNGDNQPPVVNEQPPAENNQPPEGEDPTDNNPDSNPGETTPQPTVYWLKDEGDRLALAPVEVTPSAETPTGQLESLFTQLLTETPEDDLSSTIPPGTELLSLIIQGDGIVVNLSEEFQFGGGSASMIGRVAQVLYTATSLDPTAGVWFQIEGEPLEVLGGEGLEIAQPMTRDSFTTDFDL